MRLCEHRLVKLAGHRRRLRSLSKNLGILFLTQIIFSFAHLSSFNEGASGSQKLETILPFRTFQQDGGPGICLISFPHLKQGHTALPGCGVPLLFI